MTAPKDWYRAIGVISGTSMDGIDVALVETDGRTQVRPGGGATVPYPDEVRNALLALIADPERAETAPVPEIEAAVTAAHGDAIERFLKSNGIAAASVDLIGLHGQTVFHRPQKRFTRQLGSGPAIAERFGIPVVSRFRHADVAAGGQGAPLVPLYHQALAAELPKPLMVLNLGGVGNVTYIGDDALIAFDTGPANAMLDDFVRRRRGLHFDEGGRLSAAGRVDNSIIARFTRHPYFAQPAPKSLDRNEFHAELKAIETLSDQDGAATLAEMTVQASIAALAHVPQNPLRWLVTGGGRQNTHIMRRLAAELKVPVEPVEAVGWHGDFLEAECFGYLAVRSLLGLPLSLPSTTGVPGPMTGGERAEPGTKPRPTH
jgi:anhydro-N-acetylmuramic acid kinase